MDPNTVLIWIVGASTSIAVFRTLLSEGVRSWGWLVIFSIILAVLAIAYQFDHDHAGYWSGSVWFLLVLLPAFAARVQGVFVSRQQFGVARWLAYFISILHPMDGWREAPQLMQALDLLRKGKRDEAERVLEKLQDIPTAMGWVAKLQLFRLRWQWHELLDWIEGHPRREEMLNDPTISLNYLRAYGEIGDYEAMLMFYLEYADHLQSTGDRKLVLILRMIVLSLCGSPKAVESLVDDSPSSLDRGLQVFWRITAWQHAGDELQARQILSEVQATIDAGTLKTIEQRLQSPVQPLNRVKLSPELRLSLEELERAPLETPEHQSQHPSGGFAWGTALLIAANILVFTFEPPLPDESNNQKSLPVRKREQRQYLAELTRMGALIIPSPNFEENAWRLVTANFLHYGWTHLLLNLAGLAYFGRSVERTFGRLFTRLGRLAEVLLGGLSYLIWYLLTGVGALACVLYFSDPNPMDGPQLLVGASGCVMGLVGVKLAILTVGWLKHRTDFHRQELLFLIGIIVLQTVFDNATPNVSGLAHLSGLAVGWAFGLGLAFAVLWSSDNKTEQKE